MSVTHPHATFPGTATERGFAERHPQFAPFLVGVALFVLSGAIALAFTGLPG
jgi:hypothetical protein